VTAPKAKPGRKGPKPDQARREMVVRLRESGLSFAQIGKKLHPQCSRQTARQTFLLATTKVVDSKKGGV